jgi:dihydrofolate reductase
MLSLDGYFEGSLNLASTFINLRLIDEYRLMINPIVLGQGNSFFKPITHRLKLKFQQIRVLKLIMSFYITDQFNCLKMPDR